MHFDSIHPTKQAASLLHEFKEFAFKGNVIDLAVGVIIGGAFGNLVKSLVDHVLMPLIGVVLPGEKGYLGWVLHIRGKPIPYGKFLGDVVNFLIVAFALYLFIVRFLGFIKSFKNEQKAGKPALTKEQELLTEIRDLLAQRPPAGPVEPGRP